MIYNENTGKLIMAESDDTQQLDEFKNKYERQADKENKADNKRVKTGIIKDVPTEKALALLGFTPIAGWMAACDNNYNLYAWAEYSASHSSGIGMICTDDDFIKAGISLKDINNLKKLSSDQISKVFSYMESVNKTTTDVYEFLENVIYAVNS